MRSFFFGALSVLVLLGGAVSWLWFSNPSTFQNFAVRNDAGAKQSGDQRHWFSVCIYETTSTSRINERFPYELGVAFRNRSAGILKVLDYDFGSLLDPNAKQVDESNIVMGDNIQTDAFEMRPGDIESVALANFQSVSSRTEARIDMLPTLVFGIYYSRPVLGNQIKREAEYFRLDEAPACEENRSNGG